MARFTQGMTGILYDSTSAPSWYKDVKQMFRQCYSVMLRQCQNIPMTTGLFSMYLYDCSVFDNNFLHLLLAYISLSITSKFFWNWNETLWSCIICNPAVGSIFTVHITYYKWNDIISRIHVLIKVALYSIFCIVCMFNGGSCT